MCIEYIYSQLLLHLYTFCKLCTLVKGDTANRQTGSCQQTHDRSADSTTFLVGNSLAKQDSAVTVN